ncbi:MAG: hypothetical protein JWM38_874 [Sphingomonas bacterium]|nr:hypothetical protein [Sphingomonas bacterium]MDB5717447.1 hypothetical protein [Sphingomonas bacterium]
MPSRAERATAVAALALTLASCAGSDRPRGGGASRARPVSDAVVKIGPPYRINGVTYYPRDDRSYDEVGIASWYGSESGNRTANGEAFRPKGISAAHRTLPLPSYVEVTRIDTGRTVLLRVNDRGPFHGNRIIDLSRGAADALGVLRDGSAQVRVRRVDPPERDRAALRNGKMASARPDARPGGYPTRLARTPQPMTPMWTAPAAAPAMRPPLQLDLPPPEVETLGSMASPSAPLAGWYVQVGAFGDAARGAAMLPALAQIGPTRLDPLGGVWRLRIGPYDEITARAALAQALARGYQDAMLVRPELTARGNAPE